MYRAGIPQPSRITIGAGIGINHHPKYYGSGASAVVHGGLLLEDGGGILLEDGGALLQEDAATYPVLLLESGGAILLESGGSLLMQ